VIADLCKSHAKEKNELWKLQHQTRQKTVTDNNAINQHPIQASQDLYYPILVGLASTVQNKSRAI